MPTVIWSSQWRSGSANGIWSSLLGEGGRRKDEGGEGRRKEEVTLIKSRDPVFFLFSMCVYFPVVSYIYIMSFVLSRFRRILEPVSLQVCLFHCFKDNPKPTVALNA